MTGKVPLGQSGGWIVAKCGARLTLDHDRGTKVTADSLMALGLALNHWARDPELYAVTLGDGCLGLGLDTIEADAAAALAEFSWRLECFSKPIVSLMSGEVGEVGFSFALCGTHVVAGETLGLHCRSFAAGRLPPGRLMAALARPSVVPRLAHVLAGGTIGQAEALACGLVAFAIPTPEFPSIRAALADAEPVDPVLDERHAVPPPEREQHARQPATLPAIAAVAREVLADIADREVDGALAAVFRTDQALARLGSGATPEAVRAAGGTIRLDLPSRRVLQAFRKT